MILNILNGHSDECVRLYSTYLRLFPDFVFKSGLWFTLYRNLVIAYYLILLIRLLDEFYDSVTLFSVYYI